MSNTNPTSQQPTPLQTEAYLELSLGSAVDVTAEDVTDQETDNLVSNGGEMEAESNQPLNTDQNTDSFLIARKLREHNRELVQTVMQLEQALAESQAKLQSQITRSRSADSLFSQQADTLTDSQSQISTLSRELEKAKQNARSYQEMTAELEQRFQSSQIQLAQIQRECSLLQESYNEQQQKLFTAEQEIKDLQNRLQRQQRYTLHYKSALDQQAKPATEFDLPSTNHQVPKVSRIQPWSAQAIATPTNPESNPQESQPVAKAECMSVVPVEQAVPVVLPAAMQSELDQQLAALEQEMETMRQAVEQPAPPVVKAQPMPLQFPPLASINNTSRGMIPAEPKAVNTPMIHALPTQKNWPSPTLHPLRVAKKRESLSAVDLPCFPRR